MSDQPQPDDLADFERGPVRVIEAAPGFTPAERLLLADAIDIAIAHTEDQLKLRAARAFAPALRTQLGQLRTLKNKVGAEIPTLADAAPS